MFFNNIFIPLIFLVSVFRRSYLKIERGQQISDFKSDWNTFNYFRYSFCRLCLNWAFDSSAVLSFWRDTVDKWHNTGFSFSNILYLLKVSSKPWSFSGLFFLQATYGRWKQTTMILISLTSNLLFSLHLLFSVISSFCFSWIWLLPRLKCISCPLDFRF